MTFSVKQWQNRPSTNTPIDAAALEDMETRLSAYTDTNNITIQRAGSDTFLGGSTSIAINSNGGVKRIYSNGTNWIVV